MSTLGRRVFAISSNVDVISGESDASEELARWCLVVLDVVVAGFAIGRLPVGSFIDVAFLLLFLAFSFQAADEIIFNLEESIPEKISSVEEYMSSFPLEPPPH